MTFFNDAVGRKFIYALLLVILGFILVLAGKGSAENWQNFAMIVAGIFTVGNLGDKVLKK